MKIRDYIRHSIPFVLLLFNGYLSLSIYSRSGFSHQFIVTAGSTVIVVLGLFLLNIYVDSKTTKQDVTPQLAESWPPAIEDRQQPKARVTKSRAYRIGYPFILVLCFLAICAASAAVTVWALGHPKLFSMHLAGGP